jgi:hypothetical protein
MNSQRPKAASAVEAPAVAGNKPGHKGAKKQPSKSAQPSGKLGKVVALLKRPKGATIIDLTKATGWQTHSVRGAISGAIKKKFKLTVLSEKVGEVRTYRIKG